MNTRRLRTRRGFVALLTAMTLVASMGVAAVQAVHDVGEFELDKNVSNNTNITNLGDLGANITASATSLNICQTSPAPDAPFSIQLEAERMTVTADNSGSFGGNCGGEKRTYTITRAQAGTTATAHSKGGVTGIVSLVVAQVKDGPDWDQVYAAVQADPDTDCSSLGLAECTFVHDGIGPTTFTGGSTKDHLPISGWNHTSGASPDKAEIINAFAAKAIDEDDDQILYFGMDRYAVDGSTDIGFWFFQQPVGTNADGTFSGEHVEGDILILGTFTQGGATSDIRVFKWVDAGGNEQEHIEGPTGAFGDCVPGAAMDFGCATVNDSTIPVPWTYTFKGSAKSGWVPAGGAFEGGVNLTEIGLEGCFSSFLAETRSSPSITAILKDFALGSFEACDTEIETTPSPGQNGEISIGTGSASVTDSAVIDVKGTSTWSGSLDFWLCGPDEGLCETGGTKIGATIPVDQDTTQPIESAAAQVTSVGEYCWRGVFTSATEGVPDATDASATECFDVTPVTPDLSTEAVDAEGDPQTDPVPFGDAVYDKATLGGTASQPGDPIIEGPLGAAAGGTITFTLVEDDCTTVAAVSSGTNPQDVSVSGDGDYFTAAVVPAAPGDYHWKASYSGNLPNTLGTSHNDDCDEAAEAVTVQQLQPDISTAQSFFPNDSATITVAAGGGNLNGSVDFQLFENSTCTGTPVYESLGHSVGGGLSDTVSTDNQTYSISASTQVWWKVTFESDNTAHKDVVSDCVENTELTIDNGS